MATVKKRGKSYKITVSCGYDIEGKQIRKHTTWTPSDKMTARQIAKELERQKVLFEEKCRRGQVLDGSIRFADFVEIWLKNYASTQVRTNTADSYRFYLKRILLAIGHIRLDRLQPHHLQEFYKNLAEVGIRSDGKQRFKGNFPALLEQRKLTRSALADKAGVSRTTLGQAVIGKNISYESAVKIASALGQSLAELFEPTAPDAVLSNNTIRHYHTTISTILSTAVEWQMIPYNPCDRVRPPRKQHKEPEYLDDNQAIHMLELLEALPPERFAFKTAITTLLFTGMRRSEMLGLYWSDIDLDTGVISINRTLKYLPKRGFIEDDTKNTSSRRSFKAPLELLPLLREYKDWQIQRRMMAGDQWKESERIFTSWDGTPMRPDTLTNQFRHWIDSTDLPPIHLHSLRHTNATLLIASGTNLQTISKRLGHSTSSTTANIYVHTIQSADAAAAEAVSVFKHGSKGTVNTK